MEMMDPIPSYFSDWELAHWIGTTPDQMDLMPAHMVEQARVTMMALNRAQNEANQQKGRKK